MERQRRFDAPVKPDVTVTQKRETARSQTWREHVQPDIDINMANLPRSMELDIMCDYRKNSTRRRKHDERPAFKIRIGHNFVNEIEEKITFTKSCGNLSYKRDAAILKLGNTVYSLPVEKQQKNTDFCGKLDELKHGKTKIPKYQQLHKLGLEYPVFYNKSPTCDDTTKNDDKLPKLPGETRVQSRNKSTKTTLELSNAESENKSKKREEVKFLIPKNIKAPFRRQSERYGQLNPLAKYLTPSKNKVTRTDTTDSLRTHTGSFSSSDDDDDVVAQQSTQTEIETETNKTERKHRTTDIKRSLSKLKLKNGLTSIDIAEHLPDTINEDTKTRRQLRQIYPMYNYEIEQRNRNTHEKFSRLQNSSNRLVLDNMERSLTDIKRYTPNLPKERQEYRKLYGYSMRNLNPKDILMAPDKTGDLYMEISFSDTQNKRTKIHSSDSKSRFWYSPVPNPPPTADAAYRRDPSALNSEKSTLAASVIGEKTDDVNIEHGCDELTVENKNSGVIEEVCSHDANKNDVNKEVISDIENVDVKITIENASSDDVSKSVDSEKAEQGEERNLCVSESDVHVESVDVNKTVVSDDDVVLNNQIDKHDDIVADATSDVISDCDDKSDTISSECERTTQRCDSPIYVDLKNVEVPIELTSKGKLQSENENDLSINNDFGDSIDVDMLKVSLNNRAAMLPRTPRHSPDFIEPPKLDMKTLQQNINASLDSLVVDDEDLTPRTPTQSPELKDTDGVADITVSDVCDDLEPKLKALCEDTIADSLVEERDNEIVANTVDIDTNNSNTKKLAKESLNTQNNTDENSDSLTSNNKLYRDEMIITHSTSTNINNSDEHKKKITIEGNYNRYSNTNKDDSNNDHNSIVNIIETDVNSSDSNGISNKNSSTNNNNNNIKHKNKNNNSSNNNHSNNSNTDIITNNNIKNTSTTNNLIVPSTVIHISHDNDEANDVMTADQKEKMVRDVKNMAEFTKVDSRRTGMRRSDKLTFSGCATALLSIPKVMTGEKRPPLTSRSVGCDMPNKQPLQKRQSAPGLTRRYLEIPDFKTIQRRLPRKTSYDEKSTRILEQDSERKRDIGRKNSDVVSKSQQNGKTVESKPKVTAKDITFVTPTIRF